MPATKRDEHGLTLKEEKFCFSYVTHGIEWRAYVEAYNVSDRRKQSWARVEAYRLMQKPQIRQRIRQLYLQLEREAVYGQEQAMAEAHEAYVMARDAGDTKSMVAAVLLKSKLSGLIIERNLNVTKDLGSMSSEDLARERERINDELRSLGYAALPALPAPREGDSGSGRVVPGEARRVT